MPKNIIDVKILVSEHGCYGSNCRNGIEPQINLWIEDETLCGSITYCNYCHSFHHFLSQSKRYKTGDDYNGKDTLQYCKDCKSMFCLIEGHDVCNDKWSYIKNADIEDVDESERKRDAIKSFKIEDYEINDIIKLYIDRKAEEKYKVEKKLYEDRISNFTKKIDELNNEIDDLKNKLNKITNLLK